MLKSKMHFSKINLASIQIKKKLYNEYYFSDILGLDDLEMKPLLNFNIVIILATIYWFFFWHWV